MNYKRKDGNPHLAKKRIKALTTNYCSERTELKMEDQVSMEENDNAVSVKSRLLIQPDWNEGPSSWLMVKSPGQASIRGTHDDNNPASASDSSFSVQKHRGTLVSVSHPRAGYTALFVAPSAVWPQIHEKGGVVALDVTEGGLGVSASSKGELNIWTTNNGEVRRRLEGEAEGIAFPSDFSQEDKIQKRFCT